MGLDLDKAAPAGAGAPETEITPEMIEAGVGAWYAYNFLEAEERVEFIYRAMAEVKKE